MECYTLVGLHSMSNFKFESSKKIDLKSNSLTKTLKEKRAPKKLFDQKFGSLKGENNDNNI